MGKEELGRLGEVVWCRQEMPCRGCSSFGLDTVVAGPAGVSFRSGNIYPNAVLVLMIGGVPQRMTTPRRELGWMLTLRACHLRDGQGWHIGGTSLLVAAISQFQAQLKGAFPLSVFTTQELPHPKQERHHRFEQTLIERLLFCRHDSGYFMQLSHLIITAVHNSPLNHFTIIIAFLQIRQSGLNSLSKTTQRWLILGLQPKSVWFRNSLLDIKTEIKGCLLQLCLE